MKIPFNPLLINWVSYLVVIRRKAEGICPHRIGCAHLKVNNIVWLVCTTFNTWIFVLNSNIWLLIIADKEHIFLDVQASLDFYCQWLPGSVWASDGSTTCLCSFMLCVKIYLEYVIIWLLDRNMSCSNMRWRPFLSTSMLQIFLDLTRVPEAL